MAKNFVLITLAVVSILLQTTHADRFICADEPEVCKTKFAAQFLDGFKEIHLHYMDKFKTAYNDIGNIIKSEFPANSPVISYMEESVNFVNNTLEKIHGNVGDGKLSLEAVYESARTLSKRFDNPTDTDEFDKIITKHDLTHILSNILIELAADTGNLYFFMYQDLRETDLKTYPEYTEVYVYMERLMSVDVIEAEISDFTQAAEILGTKFNLPYFAELSDIKDLSPILSDSGADYTFSSI